MGQHTATTTCAVWILSVPSSVPIPVWGLAPAERLRRVVCAAGVKNVTIYSGAVPPPDFHDVTRIVIFSADYVFDERLVRSLLSAPQTLLVTPVQSESVQSFHVVAAHVEHAQVEKILPLLAGRTVPAHEEQQLGVHMARATDLVPAYSAALRKSDPPYLLPVRDDNIAEIEARTFAASYKGLTDVVTKFVWPRPARVVTRWCAHAGVTPNMITLLSWVLVVLVTWLFLCGQFVVGLLCAWLMTFLDTVDGKLARVTLTSSRIGHVLDHGLDIIHPPFWYLAWMMGLLLSPEGGALSAGSEVAPWIRPAGMITVIGYVVGRLIEGVFMLLFKMEIHCWQPIDGFFRLITARRNPNLLLLTAALLIGRPDLGILLVAAWTLFSIAFHVVRVLQALLQQRRGQAVVVWQASKSNTESDLHHPRESAA